jgi:VTC domain
MHRRPAPDHREPSPSAPDDAVEALDPISLADLEERAALLRRVDRKYLVDRDAFAALAGRLGADHRVLEIDGRRAFGYESVYFDSPDLRCFRDHVEDRRPRYKARTRLYRDAGLCRFEVKIKGEDDATDKRQVDHPPEATERLGAEAERLVQEALGEAGLTPPAELAPVLRTCFDRITLAAAEGAARLTCDLGLRLTRMDGHGVRLRDDLVLVETKSEDGDSPADRALDERGAEEVSLSKYRVGVDLLVEADPTGDTRALRPLFG